MKAHWKSRILLAVAALVMLPAFVSPLWTIRLVAPQYPEGLGMYIYVHDVQGHDRHDLQNINILNHYIGMQPIEPETIPELEIMPIVLGALIVTGLLVALIGRPWLMATWLGLFIVAGIAGMVDFYLWNIDYGHNLSPDAPIRIPDMTYSPPIIGSTQLLNIRASSYPHLGSFFLGISALLATAAVILGFRNRKGEAGSEGEGEGQKKNGSGIPAGATALLAAILVAGCGAEPEASSRSADDSSDRIVYGQDVDPYCGELVDEVRWGGELTTQTGDRFRFQSVECLAAFLLDSGLDRAQVDQVRVVDFPNGWKLIDARNATFLHTPNLASPTGLNLMAIEEPKMQQNLQEAYAGQLIGWEEVLELVAREWSLEDGPGEEPS